jgi:hypothetical protein
VLRDDGGVALFLDRLAEARRREFVGRAGELALFADLLADGAGGIIYVYGPGGIGKTSLLHQFEWLARDHGRPVARIDASDPEQSVTGLAALDESASVVLVDGADCLSPVDRWLREEWLARLPAGAVLVLAGRHPPALGWRTDPGWRSLLRSVQLAELTPDDSRELLRRRGLPESACAAALGFARGHPLALALAAEVAPAIERGAVPAGGPDVVRDLLAGLLDAVPGRLHRSALEASAQVLVTTEPLLAAMLGEPDAHEVFGWLRGLSVVEPVERGVRPHELVRELLGAELRWRDPDRYALLHRRAAVYYHDRLGTGDHVLFELAYLHRDSPQLGPFLAHVTTGSTHLAITPMADDEWPALREMLVRHEGEESARLADGVATASTVWVVRTEPGEPTGWLLTLRLEDLDPVTREADPATAAAWRHLVGTAPLSTGETALYVRWWLADDGYQSLSTAQTHLVLFLFRQYLCVAGLAMSYLPVADPAFWADAGGYADLHRLPEADFTVGGRQYAVFAHDWRSVPPAAWLERLAARETAAESAPGPSPVVARLAEDEFTAALRAALRELGRPDRLAISPLACTAVVRDHAGSVEDAVRAAAAVLERSARDRRAYRALHHTYLQPAGTQQRAAELLDLPMSTYRRHLAEGVQRLADILWRQEQRARTGPKVSADRAGT